MEFSEWLEKKYLEWQTQAGKRKTLTSFAKWLGVSKSLMSRYLNDKVTPSLDKVQIMASQLGPEIYDVLGLARPDPAVRELQALYTAMPPEEQKEIMDIVKDFAERHGYKKVK